MTSHFPRIEVRSRGFTIVEVAVAIAACVVILASLTGVWLSGQDQFRGAMDMTIAAQVAQRVSADVEVADFFDVLRASGMADSTAPAVGALPRRYFSYVGREVAQDDPARLYEVLTRVSRSEQLPVQTGGGTARWNAQGQLILTIEVVASPVGYQAPVGADGLVDRAQCQRPVLAFPFVVGGNSPW